MNKKQISIGLIIVSSLYISSLKAKCINSSSKDSGLYISLNGAYSVPVGHFKSTIYPGMSGYAMNGYGGNIEIEHPFKCGWFGLAFESGYYTNSFNVPAFYNNVYQQILPYKITGATEYKEIPILGGIFFKKTFKRITIKLRTVIGYDIITTPYVNYAALQFSSIEPYQVQPFGESSLTDFVYYFGVSVRYMFIKHMAVEGSAGYLNCFQNSTGYIPISQAQLEIGIAYHF